MTSFTSSPPTTRVVFGPGSVAAVAQHLTALGVRRVHLIGSPRSVPLLREVLGDLVVVETSTVAQHVPRTLVDDRFRAQQDQGVDGYAAIGGGSSIGLAKAMALAARAPILAVPTTYSGSEMSPVWGVTADGVKTTGRDPAAAPALALYDPDLLATLPPQLPVTSAVNALAHAVEALLAPGPSPVLTWVASEAVRRVVGNLAGLASGDTSARADAFVGSWLAGHALAEAPMGVHHALCHALGGSQDLPHAPLHTALLPFVVRLWAGASAVVDDLVLVSVGGAGPRSSAPAPGARALQYLVRSAGGPTSLREIGADPSTYPAIAALVADRVLPLPRAVTATQVESLLDAAHRGVLDDCPVVEP